MDALEILLANRESAKAEDLMHEAVVNAHLRLKELLGN